MFVIDTIRQNKMMAEIYLTRLLKTKVCMKRLFSFFHKFVSDTRILACSDLFFKALLKITPVNK